MHLSNVQLPQLLEVVANLPQAEREHFADALVRAQFVPDDQRSLLGDAVRPGGYVDTLECPQSALLYIP